MGTTSVLPRRLETAFRLAAEAGYDGIEIMVTREPATRDARAIGRLADRFRMPVLSIHAPVLLLSQLTWGLQPDDKLKRSAALARELGATTVVVHPPYAWQRRAAQRFVENVARTAEAYGVRIAVENMFALPLGGRERDAFAPSWNPGDFAVDALTLDFSHTAMGGVDPRTLVRDWGTRLQHVHLCDARGDRPGGRLVDEHLVPGRGAQPVAAVLRSLVQKNFAGDVIAEINTRQCGRDDVARLAELVETLSFARRHLS